MSTKKVFIGGTVRPEVRALLVEESTELGITQSQLIDMILADYFTIEQMPMEYDTRLEELVELGEWSSEWSSE